MNKVKNNLRKTLKRVILTYLFKVISFAYVSFLKAKKLFKRLNRIGKGIFIFIILLFLFTTYKLFSTNIYGTYTLSQFNGLPTPAGLIVKIDKNNINSNFCQNQNYIYTDEGDVIKSVLNIVNQTCTPDRLGLFYQFSYGIQSGLTVKKEGETLLLIDGARSNTFKLIKD